MKNQGRFLPWISLILFSVLSICVVIGCKKQDEKLQDLDFTIVDQSRVPTQLSDMINEKKGQEFQLTYGDKESLYLVVGYGVKPTGGYSIQVSDVYLIPEKIVVKTDIVGPLGTPPLGETYPVVIIKMQWREEMVDFQ